MSRRDDFLWKLDNLIYAVRKGGSYGSERNAVLTFYDKTVQGAADDLAACAKLVSELREREAKVSGDAIAVSFNKFAGEQKPLDPELAKLIADDLWGLYAR